MSEAARARLAGGCAIALGLCLTLCLGGALFAGAWLRTPQLYGSADFIYACAGVNFPGRLRVGVAWNSNLAGLTPVYVSLPHTVCGYFPRPPFMPPYGLQLFQP